MTVQNIKGNIYLVKGGSGANCGFFVGTDEVIVIDAKMTAESANQMIAQIEKFTSKPITRLVLTHSDGDHVNGLGGFPKGLKIYAHDRTRKDMEDAFKKDATLQPLLASLPNQTFTDELDLEIGSEVVKLIYYGPAHTSGDVVVYFPLEKVSFVGDLVFIGRDPLIHRHKGGTSFGLVDTLRALVTLDADLYLPGHVDTVNKDDIQTLMKSIEDKQANIRTMIQEGKTLQEIKNTFGVQDRPASTNNPGFLSLVEVIYLDLAEKK